MVFFGAGEGRGGEGRNQPGWSDSKRTADCSEQGERRGRKKSASSWGEGMGRGS